LLLLRGVFRVFGVLCPGVNSFGGGKPLALFKEVWNLGGILLKLPSMGDPKWGVSKKGFRSIAKKCQIWLVYIPG